MLSQLLHYFPPHTHPLTVVSDPDGVLLSEQVMVALAKRGFRVITEPDPIALRYHVQRTKPFTAESPVIVVTKEPVNTLPYDLWQQGQHVALDLHLLFPNLTYPIIQQLSISQRERLSVAQRTGGVPPKQLSQRETIHYLLEHVFGIEPRSSLSPADLVAWLDDYHARNDPMPPLVAHHLVLDLHALPQFAGWPLHDLLVNAETYRNFVQQAWTTNVQAVLQDPSASYTVGTLPFAADNDLQHTLPRLVRSGTLTPLIVPTTAKLPTWVQPGIVQNTLSVQRQQFAEGLHDIEHQLVVQTLRWEQWQTVARLWAQLTVWRFDSQVRHDPEHLQHYQRVQSVLDQRFHDWLGTSYSALAGRALPAPHHLYHVPGWLAERQRAQPNGRVALLVLDGMALADWLIVREVWQTRCPTWCLHEKLVLAQIPSITAISRQALISGRKPESFSSSLLNNRREAQHWAQFWEGHGLPANAISYAHLPQTADPPYPDAIDRRRTQALCLVSTIIDDMVHGTTLGTADLHASLRVWLHQTDGQHQSAVWLEALIDRLLAQDYMVTLTADHGHVEALGIGHPQEGVQAVSRSKRARLYTDGALARAAQTRFPHTIVWHNDDLLPADLWVVMPHGRGAFDTAGVTVVSHGGGTIDELIVPLITITKG